MLEAYRPPEKAITREDLVFILKGSVIAANCIDSNALGVLLFGSRTHNGAARKDSDVDIIHIQDSPSVKTSYVLAEAIDSNLNPLGLRVDYQSTVYMRWMHFDDDLRADLRRRLSFLDRDSEFITIDEDIAEKLKEFSGAASREWWKLALKPPQDQQFCS